MTLPLQYQASMSAYYMPVVNATFQDNVLGSYYISNNQPTSSAWSIGCEIPAYLATDPLATQCSDSPVLAVDTLNTSTFIDGQLSVETNSGYDTVGNLYSVELTLNSTLANMTTAMTNLNAVQTVNADTWLYGVPASNGYLGFGFGSGWMALQGEWSIELGNIANQSFTGTPYIQSEPVLYIGAGDYTTIYTGDSSNSTTSQSINSDNAYNLTGAWFGLNATGIYYSSLGYSLSPTSATIALNYQGIGLPIYEWTQLVNLMSLVSIQIAQDLSCTAVSCVLAQPCATYTDLWTYSLMLQFDPDSNYVTVSIGSIAIDNQSTGQCDLYLQQNAEVILGSLWFQNFLGYFQGDLLSLQVSAFALQGALISSDPPLNTMSSPFTSLPNPLSFKISQDGYSASVQADFGLQGMTEFLLSTTSSIFQAYSSNCMTVDAQSCAAAPNYATNYFELSKGTEIEPLNSTVDGYSTQGFVFNQTICFSATEMPTTQILCTPGNQAFFVADTLVSNNWNYQAKSFSGILGLAQQSPFWALVNPLNSADYFYQILLSNVTDDSLLVLGTGQPILSENNITVSPINATSQLFGLTNFGFGTADMIGFTESYQSLINGDEVLYGIYANTTLITTDFRGIGLPTTSYNRFVNLLSIATQGSVACDKQQGGYCVLPGLCSGYEYLLSYSFYIQLAGDSSYMIVPLVSFAYDQISGNATVNRTDCSIYVEMLDESLSNSQQIVLGVGFLRAFSFQQLSSNATSLAVNPYSTYANLTFLGAQTLTVGPDAFVITPMTALVVETENNQAAIVSTAFSGVPSGQSTFMLDLSNQMSVVWNQDCMYEGAPCANPPTYLNANFTTSETIEKAFTQVSFGGYLASGNIYIAQMNPNLNQQTDTQRLLKVYSATTVYEDAWFFDEQTNAVGTLGYGPESSFWYQFTDPISNTATFSVALGNNGSASNITFGAGSTVGFETATPLVLSAATVTSNVSFALEQMGFGIVYQTDGVDTSSYFANFTQSPNVIMTLNFIGLGLPQTLWAEFTPLLQNITANQSSCNTTNGICTLPGSCAQYDLSAYSFQMMFVGSSNYVNVPLSTFQYDGTNTCDIYVQQLNTTLSQSNNVILGSMFFRNFYGIWVNQYNVTGADAQITQNLTLFINVEGTAAYIGNQMLPLGKSPFYTAPTYQNISVSINSTSMTASIQASIGSGGLNSFMVSLTKGLVQTYAVNCTASTGTGQSSCASQPNYCTDYFNMAGQTALEPLNVTYDGYVSQGYLYNESFCLNATDGLQCTTSPIYAADVLLSNDWNYGSPGTAGIIGLAEGSPVWNSEPQSIYGYWVQFSNFTNWSFVNASAAKTKDNYIRLGFFNDTTYASAPNITLTPKSSPPQSYALDSFEFGITNFTNLSSSYQSIINSEEVYGIYANSTKITLDTSGIGLPTTSFNQFASLLEIATAGQVNCIKLQGGFCILPKTCSSYASLWAYSFKIQFTGANNTLIVPLASFAADQTITKYLGSPTVQCQIYVQMLDETYSDSLQIVMGSMLFQSVVMNQQFGPGATNQTTLAVNINAPPNTYIGSDTFQEQANAFSIVQDKLNIYNNPASLFPTVIVKSADKGYPSGTSAYFMIDFSNDQTVVWDRNCLQNLSGIPDQSCSYQPVYVNNQYFSQNPAVTSFTNVSFGGYLTSGSVFVDTLCIDVNCKEVLVNSATSILEDNWLYNEGVSSLLSYGNLGYGPNSPAWNQYINPQNGVATYGISLNKTNVTKGNVTLGGSFSNLNASVSLVSNDQALYNLTTIGFGIVYQTDGVDSSSYFSNLTTAPVQFSINFQGLGLPSDTYVEWTDLMANLTNDEYVDCQTFNGSLCILPSACSSYDWINSFSFQMIFEGSSNYMRVPLSTFSVSTTTSCSLYVIMLQPDQTQASNIILGYQYFENFQGTFSNQYSLGAFVNQTASLFIQPTFNSNVAYIGNEMLPQGKTPFDSAPLNYLCAIGSNYQVIVNAQFGNLESANYQIDNNAGYSYAWTTACQQSSELANRTTDLDCSNAPSYVTESLNLDLISGGAPYAATIAGGYTTTGNNLKNSLQMFATGVANSTMTSINMHAVVQITGNSWQYGIPTSSGAIAFGGDSQWVSSLVDPDTKLSTWSLEVGNVADQSFTGANYTQDSQRLYMGTGNYSKLYTFNSSNSISLYTNKDGNYDIARAWFGTTNSSSAYFLQLGYDLSVLEATIAFNFPGIGLPQYEYEQLINLLYRINSQITADLTCNITTSNATGICQLANSCSSNRYTELWAYQLKIQFDIAANNYTTVGIGSFAIDNGDVCNLYIQLLQSGTAQSSNLVLGSMWLQNFVALFIVDYSGVTNTDQLVLTKSKYALPYAAINTVGPSQTAINAFDYLPQNIVIDVAVSDKLAATVTASLGYQGDAQFLVSLTGSLVQAYSTDCQTADAKSCNVAPYYSTNYFNTSNAIPIDTYNVSNYDGYSSQGQLFNQSVCLTASNLEMFCSVNNQAFFVANTLTSNEWNYGSESAAGIFGLGPASPVWNMTNLNKNNTQYLSVQFQNVTDWSFYTPGYTLRAPGNQIILGKPTSQLYASATNITITPESQQGSLVKMTDFQFGIYNSATKVESMTSIINDQVNGSYTNTTRIALDFRGIGLPTTSYTKFVSLIGIASAGAANCFKTQGGYCVLPSQCIHYAGLWDYSFKIVFPTNQNYLVVPLASFAAETTELGYNGCAVYVEMLNETLSESQSIILGQMFFQTVAFTSQQQSATQMITLALNVNAMSGAYLGSQTVTENSTSAFQVQATTAPVSSVQSIGLPSFVAAMQGFPEEVTPYFMIDFSNDHTVVWDSSCQQSVTEPYGPCSNAPTLLMTSFTNATNIVGTFTNKEFGGFLCSGNLVLTNVCISQTCRLVTVYATTLITQDSWLYGQPSAYGILGYGPGSPLWNQYIDQQGSAEFSVSLARTPRMVSNDIVQSNVTFGSQGNIQDYATEPCLTIQTSTSSYGVTEFGFGKVYVSNGVSVSSYFYNMTTKYPLTMSTNFQGLGLPTVLYSNYTNLLQNLTGSNATCMPVSGGVCVLQGNCSVYSYLESFSFQIMFESNSAQYMRVPLSTFAIQVDGQCKLAVSNLDPQMQGSSSIILGGMFFEEFYGAATNQYNLTSEVVQSQTVSLFVQLNAIQSASYIGNEMLPMGDNPFYVVISPNEPSDTASIVWIVILCVVISLLAGFLGWSIYRWRQTAEETNDKRYIVYNTDDRKHPLNNFVSDSEL